MLPDGWKSGKIKDFFMLQRGFDLTKAQARSGNVPVISSSGVSYYHDTYKVIGPGIVTGRKGNIGDVHIINENFWPHDTALWVSDFKSNNINYIKYFLDYVNLKKFDEASSVPTLNRNNVLCLNCSFPPLPEQKKIAAILSTWDRAI
ncbi:restriction endonuclease subunit S [Gluconobacter albidus]|uniref:restriction endonuclease subunit S n=1 Tax=Gluconobacter albidus TaxID=318683 RepID=UPI00098B50F9|nr:restriction endonuclease subunit S [Gluconobacter albidus]